MAKKTNRARKHRPSQFDGKAYAAYMRKRAAAEKAYRRKTKRRNPPSKRKQRKMVARVRWAEKKNAPRMKRLNKSTPWIPATAVKIVRNKGRYEVLYRRKRSAVKKRPARRKTARRR
jgi:hypothetical protein